MLLLPRLVKNAAEIPKAIANVKLVFIDRDCIRIFSQYQRYRWLLPGNSPTRYWSCILNPRIIHLSNSRWNIQKVSAFVRPG